MFICLQCVFYSQVDAPLQSDASSYSQMTNYNSVSTPIPQYLYSPYVPPTNSANSIRSFYAPPMSTSLVPNSFTSYTAPYMSTDGFTPVYDPSVSTPSFSFPNTWQDFNWNVPLLQMSPACSATWLQTNLSPVSAEHTSLHQSIADSLPVLPYPKPPQLPVLLPYPNLPNLSEPHPNPPQGIPNNSLPHIITKLITDSTQLERKAVPSPRPLPNLRSPPSPLTITPPSSYLVIWPSCRISRSLTHLELNLVCQGIQLLVELPMTLQAHTHPSTCQSSPGIMNWQMQLVQRLP